MFKKNFLKLLVICLLFGNIQRAKPIDPMFALVVATAFVPGICIGVMGCGAYSLLRPLTEREFLEKNILLLEKINKFDQYFELSKNNEINSFLKLPKIKEINNKRQLNRLVSGLNNYSKKLENNRSRFNFLISQKEKKHELIGMHDIENAVNDINDNLSKINKLQTFINKNQNIILAKY